MKQPAPRGLPAISAYLRDLALLSRSHIRANHVREIATQLDQTNRELRHLSGLSAHVSDLSTPERLQTLFHTHKHWQRTQDEADAEAASGA